VVRLEVEHNLRNRLTEHIAEAMGSRRQWGQVLYFASVGSASA
jgi:hypothetical protein